MIPFRKRWWVALTILALSGDLPACADPGTESSALSPEAWAESPGYALFQPTIQLGGRRLKFSVCAFHVRRFAPRVVSNRSARQSLAAYAASSPSPIIAGVNGGFFHPRSFLPQGLVVANGGSEGAFDTKSWMEGVFLVRTGKPELRHRDNVGSLDEVGDLLQTGPWLVRDEVVQKGFTNDEQPRPRTFICQGSNDRWAIGVCDSATLHDLAEALRAPLFNKNLNVQNALNLDGGPSTGFYMVNSDGRVISKQEQWEVPNFVVLQAVSKE